MFTTRQASLVLGITQDYLCKLIRDGHVPAKQYVAGGRYYVDIDRVQRGMLTTGAREPESRANACWMLLCRGLRVQAQRTYSRLDPESRSWVDRKCLDRGIIPPTLPAGHNRH